MIEHESAEDESGPRMIRALLVALPLGLVGWLGVVALCLYVVSQPRGLALVAGGAALAAGSWLVAVALAELERSE